MYMLEILSAVFSLSYFVLIYYLLYYFGGVIYSVFYTYFKCFGNTLIKM